MHVKEHLNDLLHHMAWGDALLWAIALDGDGASPAFLERAHHTHLVQHAFLTVLTDAPFTHTKPEDYASPAELVAWGKQQITGLLKYSELIQPASLAQRHQIPWFDENQSHPTELEMLTQVAMHTQHHRAQNLIELKSQGCKLIAVDYIYWVTRGRQPAEWPSA